MWPLNLMQLEAQTRKLRKSQFLFCKVGKSKQIRKMAITSVLTMLMSPFWAHFASLDCPNQISKNKNVVRPFTEKLKNASFESTFAALLVHKLETDDNSFIKWYIIPFLIIIVKNSFLRSQKMRFRNYS